MKLGKLIAVVCLLAMLMLTGCGAKNEITAIRMGASNNLLNPLPATADGCYWGSKGSMKHVEFTFVSGECAVEVKYNYGKE